MDRAKFFAAGTAHRTEKSDGVARTGETAPERRGIPAG